MGRRPRTDDGGARGVPWRSASGATPSRSSSRAFAVAVIHRSSRPSVARRRGRPIGRAVGRAVRVSVHPREPRSGHERTCRRHRRTARAQPADRRRDVEPFEPTLDAGVPFYVVAGPVFADGYAGTRSTRTMATRRCRSAGSPRAAVKASPGSSSTSMAATRCTPVEDLATEPAQQSLYCYGVQMPGDFELTGNLFCDFGDVEGLHSGPDWIEFDRFCELRAPDWNIHDGISLRIWGQAARACSSRATRSKAGTRSSVTSTIRPRGRARPVAWRATLRTRPRRSCSAGCSSSRRR